ncbi:MAG: zinc metalloprotease, partial [Flavobacteriaceae bacterium]|nr:zinc metalloprotease [Flavobacteriaceae bacterium]
MKKIFLSAALLAMLFSCQNEDSAKVSSENLQVNRYCASQEVLERQLQEDPTLALRMNKIEEFTENFSKTPSSYRLVNGKIEIPVVVNVLYKTAAENISLTQIQSQIDVLNKDFTATNPDFANTPAEFAGVAANVGITFELVKIN